MRVLLWAPSTPAFVGAFVREAKKSAYGRVRVTVHVDVQEPTAQLLGLGAEETLRSPKEDCRALKEWTQRGDGVGVVLLDLWRMAWCGEPAPGLWEALSSAHGIMALAPAVEDLPGEALAGFRTRYWNHLSVLLNAPPPTHILHHSPLYELFEQAAGRPHLAPARLMGIPFLPHSVLKGPAHFCETRALAQATWEALFELGREGVPWKRQLQESGRERSWKEGQPSGRFAFGTTWARWCSSQVQASMRPHWLNADGVEDYAAWLWESAQNRPGHTAPQTGERHIPPAHPYEDTQAS